MRTSRVSAGDVTATFVVALAALLFGLHRAGVDAAGLDNTRLTAALVFGLGIVACTYGADVESFYRAHTPRLLVLTVSALGAVALGVGVAALVAASDMLLTFLVGTMVALWLVTTVRHVRTGTAVEDPVDVPAERPRELARR